MDQSSSHEITQLLHAWSNGDESAFERLIPLVQNELHRLARNYMRKERAGHILQTTALIHEVYIRLLQWNNLRLQDRANLYGVAAMLMRRALVDYARQNPGLDIQVYIDEEDEENIPEIQPKTRMDLIALDDALTSLAKFDRRKSQVVELRFFGGFTVEETAEALGISTRVVSRDWAFASAWLYRALKGREKR